MLVLRGEPKIFGHGVLALLCIAAALTIWLLFTFPVNRTAANWTVLSDHWLELRKRWEYSHAVRAALFLIALIALVALIV